MDPSPAPVFRKGTLASIVGSLGAVMLLSTIPMDESGRTVAVTVAADGTASVRHVSGPQYLRSYLDIASVATACDGVTTGVRKGQVFTEAQCGALLEKELVRHADGVLRCSPALQQPGRDWQRVAAVNHAYQFGIGAWCSSSAHDLIEVGAITDGCAALLLWNKVRIKGVLQFSTGVQRRSHRRQEYCRTGMAGFPVDTLQARLARWN